MAEAQRRVVKSNLAVLFAVLFVLGLGCATRGKIPVRPPLKTFKEPAYRMKLFYEYRLNASKQGWYVQWFEKNLYWGDRELPAFFEKNKDPTAANWSRGANRMDTAGWLLGLSAEAAFIYASAVTKKDELKPMAIYGLLPSALLTWGFHQMSNKWFRRPAVAHYNRQLKRELDLSPE